LIDYLPPNSIFLPFPYYYHSTCRPLTVPPAALFWKTNLFSPFFNNPLIQPRKLQFIRIEQKNKLRLLIFAKKMPSTFSKDKIKNKWIQCCLVDIPIPMLERRGQRWQELMESEDYVESLWMKK
jgi:hypothetical protein